MNEVIPILMYHSVDDVCSASYRPWAVCCATFDAQMKILDQNGFRPITLSSLMSLRSAGKALPPRTVVITFDDGLRDFLTGAMPILERYGFPATLFVVSGRVGETSTWLEPLGEGNRPMLSRSELRFCVGRYRNRRSLAHASATRPAVAEQAFAEIVTSKTVLEEHLGKPISTFAYPYGYSSKLTRDLVAKAGFAAACGVRHALSAVGENKYSLSRIMITADVSDEDFEKFLSGTGLPVAPAADRLSTTGWRMVRRVMRIAESR
jgi:O-antigen biosynthesis protein